MNNVPGRLSTFVLAVPTAADEGAIGDWGALHLRQDLGAGAGLAAVGYAAFGLRAGLTTLSLLALAAATIAYLSKDAKQ